MSTTDAQRMMDWWINTINEAPSLWALQQVARQITIHQINERLSEDNDEAAA